MTPTRRANGHRSAADPTDPTPLFRLSNIILALVNTASAYTTSKHDECHCQFTNNTYTCISTSRSRTRIRFKQWAELILPLLEAGVLNPHLQLPVSPSENIFLSLTE